MLKSPELYSEELIFCAQRIAAERQRVRDEAAAKAAEQARLARERAVAERRAARRARNAALWRRWRPYIFAALAAGTVVAAILYLTSDGYRYRRAVKFAETGRPDRAIGRLLLLDDPTFERYSSAKYLLYGQYLAKCDSVAAAEALTAAVAAKDWSDQQAYDCYVAHCLEGTFEPHIRMSKRSAADYYACAPDEIRRLKSGALYFELNSFKAAYEVLEPLSHEGTASIARGYIGLMYLYGQGGLEQDFEKAYDYLKGAPNTLPFIVHKGDLTLYLRKGDVISAIQSADECYAIAAANEPDNKAYVDRHTVTSRILEAYRKDLSTDYWCRGPVYWSRYAYSGGRYVGQYTVWGNRGGAHGWGCYYGVDGKRWIRLGKYACCSNAGFGIDITNRYWVSVGTLSGRGGTLVSGVEIAPNGAVTVK